MARATRRISDATRRFHQIVEQGSLEELQTALRTNAPANAPGHCGITALMVAIDVKDLQKVELLIGHGADPELTDEFNATALEHAVDANFPEAVRLLIGLGVDRGFHPKYPLKKVDYDFPLPRVEMPEALRQVMSEEEWNESVERSRESIRDLGQNPKVEPLISHVQSVEVLKLFLEAGDDLNLAPFEVKRALSGLETGDKLSSTFEEYQSQKSPRFGSSNPERMDLPFWRDMIRNGCDAYTARLAFNDTDRICQSGPVWCYKRFGSSLTPLPDGRHVQIGGEHEDYYDPDFCIYNDVVIHDGKGGFQIFGYPREVFPPTDFHTATLCGDRLYIIGCLGYMDQRRSGSTPVYRLMLESWRIEAVNTTGDMPGWIFEHRASFDAERNAIVLSGGEIHRISEAGDPELVPNEGEFELDLAHLSWRRSK
jgi:hypothetical protein